MAFSNSSLRVIFLFSFHCCPLSTFALFRNEMRTRQLGKDRKYESVLKFVVFSQLTSHLQHLTTGKNCPFNFFLSLRHLCMRLKIAMEKLELTQRKSKSIRFFRVMGASALTLFIE